MVSTVKVRAKCEACNSETWIENASYYNFPCNSCIEDMRQTKVEIIAEYIKKDGRCLVPEDNIKVSESTAYRLDNPLVGH